MSRARAGSLGKARSRGQRARYLAWGAAWVLAACDPDQPSSLRPAGPPEVLTVLVSNDRQGERVDEAATFCKLDDDKRPALVPANPNGPSQVCPDDLTEGAPEVVDATPNNWYVRIQFDELLDGDRVEELIEIGNDQTRGTLVRTQPVVLRCNGVVLAYDGYYNSGGNSLTWPLGPSLILGPTDGTAIPSGAACDVAIREEVVRDKDGAPVPEAQRGPYAFKIAALALTSTTPAASTDGAPVAQLPTAPAVLWFNAAVDPASLAASEVAILEVDACDAATGVAHPAAIAAGGDTHAIAIRSGDAGGAAWLADKIYRVTLSDATVADLAGATVAVTETLCFRTGA